MELGVLRQPAILVVSGLEGRMTKRAAGGGGALSQAGRLEIGDFSRAASLA